MQSNKNINQCSQQVGDARLQQVAQDAAAQLQQGACDDCDSDREQHFVATESRVVHDGAD